MTSTTSTSSPHRGGQLGLAGLVIFLIMSGCMAFSPAGPAEGQNLLPKWLPFNPAQTIPAQAKTIDGPAQATFIVRFRGEDKLDALAKSFRKDPVAARSTFKDWCDQHDGLEGLVLERASYSGELIVALPSDDPLNRSPEDVMAALKRIDTLVYADIDSIAKPSAED